VNDTMKNFNCLANRLTKESADGGEGNLRAVSTWLSCDGANAGVPCSNFEVGLRFDSSWLVSHHRN
jgi:hypothetical protein